MAIEIIMDDREPRAMSDHLRQADDALVVVKRLPLGDYLVDDRLLFERKRLPDLAASIKSGRLFSQACRLASCNCRAVFILEGKGADLKGIRMPRAPIQGAIISLTVVLGLPLLRSRSPRETARLIVYTARQVQRLPQGAVYRHGYRPKGERKRKLFVLQGLPGIGPGRAARLLDHFGSLEAVFLAESDELADVAGIGYPTAKKIRKLVREFPDVGYSA